MTIMRSPLQFLSTDVCAVLSIAVDGVDTAQQYGGTARMAPER